MQSTSLYLLHQYHVCLTTLKASKQNPQRSESLDYPEKQNMQLVSCKHQSLANARCSHTVTVTTDSMAQTG